MAHGTDVKEHKQPNYFGVFMARTGVITWPRPVINSFYISMAVVKALLVALYYMHLKFDSRLYAVLFGVPCIFAVVFFTLLLI